MLGRQDFLGKVQLWKNQVFSQEEIPGHSDEFTSSVSISELDILISRKNNHDFCQPSWHFFFEENSLFLLGIWRKITLFSLCFSCLSFRNYLLFTLSKHTSTDFKYLGFTVILPYLVYIWYLVFTLFIPWPNSVKTL